MNQEFICEMQQILNDTNGQTPSIIVENFITTIGNKELSILNGEITTEDFIFLIPLVNENSILEQRQKDLLIESLNISIKNAEIATQLRHFMANGSVTSLRPILILNMHNDPAMYMLLTNSIADLVKTGYHTILNEDVSEGHLSEQEWNQQCDAYLQNLSKKEQEYLKLSSLNTNQVLELFKQATEDFQNGIEQDIIVDLKDKEQVDQFDKEFSSFTLKCNAMVYERRYHEALSGFRIKNPGQEIATENFDTRGKVFGNEQDTNLLLHLSNIGFALQIALKSYVSGGAVLIVGLAHGQGICDIYGKLFPQLLQPLSIIPCHYTFTKETPVFISDSFRHKQYIIKDFLRNVQHMEYAIIDMALYFKDAANHFVKIIADQKVCEDDRLKLFSGAVIAETVQTTASNSAPSSSGLLIPSDTKCDTNIDVDTINITYTYKAKFIKRIGGAECSVNNLRTKFALLLDYKRMLKNILSDIKKVGIKIGGGEISIVSITAAFRIAGNVYTFNIAEAMAKRLQIENSDIATAHIEEITEEPSVVPTSAPITPAFQSTTMQRLSAITTMCKPKPLTGSAPTTSQSSSSSSSAEPSSSTSTALSTSGSFFSAIRQPDGTFGDEEEQGNQAQENDDPDPISNIRCLFGA